jgi:hypothetical protein
VEAYICLDDNSEAEKPAALTQGSPFQVCVKIDETFVAGNIIVEDILTLSSLNPTVPLLTGRLLPTPLPTP